jgi:hypothetical protein
VQVVEAEEGENVPVVSTEGAIHPEFKVHLVIRVRTMVADQEKAGKTRWLYA